MSAGAGFVINVLRSAADAPAEALVRLYLHLRNDRHFERDFQWERCETEAEHLLERLSIGPPFPITHPAAALRAIDRFMLEARDPGQPNEQVRFVDVPAEEGGGRYWLVRRRPGWSSHLAAEQAGQREYWLRGHQVVPALHDGIGIAVKRPHERLWRRLEGAAIRFAAGGFLDGVQPNWTSTSPLSCRKLIDPESRWTSVQAVLEEARSHGATIVVLPELTVDPEVRQRLRRWLRENPSHPFALVVAGSFHESRPGVEVGPGQGVARVFDAFGDEVLAHVKLRPMRTEKKGRRVAEDLEGSGQVDLVLAPFGLLGVAICLDFCESGDVAVANLWTRVGPALMLVPSMGGSSTNNAHGRRAEDLARVHATATVVASQHPEEKAALGLCWRVGGTANGERTVDAVSRAPVLLDELKW